MNNVAGGIPRYRPWSGPALLSAGFRPFFLIAGAWAALAVPLWLSVLNGHIALPSAFDPVAWHAHEMLFGFVQAAVAGFLLTAVPNWTGWMPIQGWSLGALAALFLLGRVAVFVSGLIGAGAAAALDLASRPRCLPRWRGRSSPGGTGGTCQCWLRWRCLALRTH